MNRYPLWKNLLVITVLIIGFIYTLPNFFADIPAIQISSLKSSIKIDAAFGEKVLAQLKEAGVENPTLVPGNNTLRVSFPSDEQQKKAKDALEHSLNAGLPSTDPNFVVAHNPLPGSPAWLQALHARPMNKGLDLQGGVHFLMQIDMKGALTKRMDSSAADIRALLRDKDIRHAGITREANTIIIRFKDEATRTLARTRISDTSADFSFDNKDLGADDLRLVVGLTEPAQFALKKSAVEQNKNTLHKRVDELGVAEPVILQQGAERIVVQLPGVQDPAKAKEILGRTATLELRMVDDNPGALEEAVRSGTAPVGSEVLYERDGRPVLVKKEVRLTGDRLQDAVAGVDGQNQMPAVHLKLDSAGAKIFRDLTRDNVNKRMAILLVEKNKAEVVTAPVIREEIGGGQVQISGSMSSQEAADIALLLRAGSLAAPMEIIEERTVGPSLGKENIERGFKSTLWGFVAIATFMVVYYAAFGVISVLALSANLLLLVALLSILQATLTLPGIAAIALTLGMAIDANVLINERIREELRRGEPPQSAINAGYHHAFDTILDSNVTTFIAGLALLVFGSGPVRGFAVVHCLGILTSMFSAVLVSRMLTNFIYGNRRRLEKISIG